MNSIPLNGQFFNQKSAAAFEMLINRVIQLDPQGHEGLATFKDKVIQVTVDDLDLNYYCRFPNQSIAISNLNDKKVSAVISGKLSDYIQMALKGSKGGKDAVFTGEIHFSGDINTARQFQEYLLSLNLDWQEPISQIFGDVAGYQISKGIVGFASFMEQWFDETKKDIPEILQHELNVTPSHLETEHFFEKIGDLRGHADRLEAKIKRLIKD
ncbi:MAG: SCP2 sterol-binding domain-containing protein [Gammaproteobacteria bacterium]|nr:SCP2 sterol-binding domain-containing protein [Gammaproteobacteria bacterium]